MPGDSDAQLLLLTNNVTVLEQRIGFLTDKLDTNINSVDKVKDSFQEVAIYIAEISEKIATYTTIHGDAKSRIDDDIKDLWDRTSRLLESSGATGQLHIDIQSFKTSLETFKNDIGTIKVEMSSHKEEVNTSFKDVDVMSEQKCKECKEIIDEKFDDFKSWMDNVDGHIEDGKVMKYGIKGVYLFLIIIGIIFGLLSIKYTITPKIDIISIDK